jgi:hypothetical protein
MTSRMAAIMPERDYEGNCAVDVFGRDPTNAAASPCMDLPWISSGCDPPSHAA